MPRMMRTDPDRKGNPVSVFKVGAVSLAFLILGYQVALFVNRTAILHIEAMRDHPDTVFVVDESLARSLLAARDTACQAPAPRAAIRREARHSSTVQAVREAGRAVESFPFNPNLVSAGDLRRLGFSEKQAAAIVRYREAGGRFFRKGDFAKSYVVADSVYRRLEPFIEIPKLDLNLADSAALDYLPGIGGYYAVKILEYREKLGGFSYPEQLMDLYRFDADKYARLSDLVCCSPPQPFRLWSLPADSLRLHPYIRNWQTAKAIVLYREHTRESQRSVAGLLDAGILDPDTAAKLSRCRLE